MPRYRITTVIALCVGLAITAAGARADDAAKARHVLDEVAKAYQSLPAYADRGEFQVGVTVDDKPYKSTRPFRLTLIRPNLLKVEADGVTTVSDGKSLTTTVGPTKRFAVAPAPAQLSIETFRAGPLGSVLFGGPTERLAFILVNLLVGEDPVKTLLAELDAQPTLEGDREADGVKYTLLRLDAAKGPDYRLVIDPGSKLLAAIEVVIDSKDAAKVVPAEAATVERIDWRAGRVETKAEKDELVAYKPPDGYTKVEPFDKVARVQADVPKNRVEDLIGKLAPNFSLTVLDPSGKFQTVTRDDLAGKVVLIDFWATWCDPCLAELPEVQKLIEAYAQDKKDVVVVALSQDERPSELNELRKLVEKTLAEKKIMLTGNAIGKIALDPSQTIGEAFQVEGYPTVVIVDAKGTVQAAHVGFRRDVREALTRDIDTLLEGKALAKPKTKPNE